MTTEVVLTGTGTPRADAERAGAGTMVRVDDLVLQFDVGRATVMRLVAAGVQPAQVDAVFVTHHHSDHLVGLVDLVFCRWLDHGTAAPALPIVAPEGPACRFASSMLDPWVDDIEVRRSHHEDDHPPEVDVRPFTPGSEPVDVWSDGSVTVSACAVHHEPVTPAVAYRVSTPDGVVVVSGDTIVCPEMEAFARGADVLVHETFHRDVVRPFFPVMPALEAIADYHADTPELGAMAARAGVDTLVLTHLIPPPNTADDEQRFADAVTGAGFDGTVIVGRDLTSVVLG